ncbi:MAG: ROK family protein [Limnoraphis robusta]|jgi:polyphosphate glucokinase
MVEYSPEPPRTLAIDIGGSGIKMMVLNLVGEPLTQRARVETPQPATPELVIAAVSELARQQGEFERVSVGFPGVVVRGVTKTAVNLHPEWLDLDFAGKLSHQLGKPVRVANDADIQGLGAISGHGVELVLTLGTGIGTALFLNGRLVPNLEGGHHPFRKGETYEQQLGNATLEKIGKKRWNLRLEKALKTLHRVLNCDRIYLGGGNTKKINFELPNFIEVIPNVTGILGGIRLWESDL